MKKRVIVPIMVLVISSALIMLFCFVSTSEIKNLGEDFYYLPKWVAIDVGNPYGSMIYKSRERDAYSQDDIIVNQGILQVVSDEFFILYVQNKSQNDSEKDNIPYYWGIIQKEPTERLGPYDYHDYCNAKNILGVPNNLRLKYERKMQK